MSEGLKRAADDFERFGVSAYDLPSRDKIPVIRELMGSDSRGLALDIGIGTGYTTYHVFGDRLTVCVDLHAPNLKYYRKITAARSDSNQPLCVVARAASLPFEAGSFRFILCSEVLEHLEDDDAAVREIARLLADDGRVVVTVPYTGLGFTGFLELCGIKTVHDFPGPEHHVRPGYDEQMLRALFARHGLELERHAYWLRFFTRAAVDVVALAHLLYQRIVRRRRAWTWSEAAEAEGGVAFSIYTWVVPIFQTFSKLDALLGRRRGFGIAAVARKRAGR
jgi:SAM-dependent methyltransferase